MEDGTEPVADGELLYRRVSVPSGWYSSQSGLKADAFAPHKTRDMTGVSVDRAKYKSAEQAAKGLAGKSYFVAVLRAGDLRQRGIEVVPQPVPEDPAHAELPDLNSGNRKTDRTLKLQEILVELTLRVEGPFAPA